MMRTHISRYKKSSADSLPRSQETVKPQLVTNTLPVAQTKSNEEGLAEWEAQRRKWARMGTPWMDKVPNLKGELAQPWIQGKLTIGEPGDKYEQEADRVAAKVVQQLHAPTSSESVHDADSNEVVRRQSNIQRFGLMEGGAVSPEVETSIQQARSGGRPLDASIRQPMEQAFGANFSGVRVHTDTQADALNRSLLSRAFTTKQDVFFKRGEYQPENKKGQELLAHELTHVVQQNDQSVKQFDGNVLQRMQLIKKSPFGDLIELEDKEELPKNDGYEYRPAPESDTGKKRYWRQQKAKPKKRDKKELEKIKKESIRKNLQKRQSDLFDQKHGGDKEGTFEYVANYLYAEVHKADGKAADEIWAKVWEVKDDEITKEPKRVRKDNLDQKELLQEMIDIGLDASWKKLPIKEVMDIEVKNKKPASTMGILQIDPTIWDYLSDIWYWRPWTQSKTLGVGFHTTDGEPSTVMKSKDEGGWGGITRPMTAPFFQKRYALDKSWNPLGTWLNKKGPTFRKGIKDNELLSTVSIATDLHKSIKFPLANKNRTHEEENNKDNINSFKMTAYAYAVVVTDAYATFEKQDNPFPEIATGDVPIKDIIGSTKITRWHDYHENSTEHPNDSSFYYQVDNFVENPEGPKNEALTNIARNKVAEERNKSANKYTPSQD